MGKIAVLPDELINQIAAGEVVERPASVIKELAENAIDAGARTVRVTISRGGLERISIVDDGHGMSREDALLSLQRHATSKLRDANGLTRILTKGFRGEALPSIASVSRFRLVTSEPHAPAGVEIRLEGGAGRELSDAAPIGGTQIDVEDLFFNTPARRKFLKREETEAAHCEEAVLRLALAHPEVSFVYERDGKRSLSASGGDLRERISAALGAEVGGQLLEVEERRLGLAVRGFVARPELTFNNARGVYTFVNRRYIRDRGINAALQRAFAEHLPPGRQPIAVLFLEVEPTSVDVNVHPQKLEVRFSDPRSVYDALHAAVARAVNVDARARAVTAPASAPADYAFAVEKFLSRAQGAATPWVADAPVDPSWGRPGFGTAAPGTNEAPPRDFFKKLLPLGMLAHRLWVCEGEGGSLCVVDPHALLERLSHQRLEAATDEAPSLFSVTVDVQREAMSKLLARAEALRPRGLLLEPFGEASVRVQLPSAASGVEAARVVRWLVEGVDAEVLWRRLSCECASVQPLPTTAEALRALLRELEEERMTEGLTHGRVVLFELSLRELEGRRG